MWKKVAASTRFHKSEKPRVSVYRSEKSPNTAQMSFHRCHPEFVAGGLYSIYQNGDAFGISINPEGDRRIGGGKTAIITLPRVIAERMPFGSTEVQLSDNSGMLVLDTSAHKLRAKPSAIPA